MTSRTAKAKEARHERQCREVKEQRAPTEKEAAAILTAQAKAATLPTRPEIRSEITGQTAQSLPLHNDHKGWSAQLQAAFGSESSTFCGALLTQLEPLVRADPKERATDGQTNYALALMAGIDPEMLISETGYAISPFSIQNPPAPREKSPVVAIGHRVGRGQRR